MKTCKICGVPKPISDFYNKTCDPNDGKRPNCKTCTDQKIQKYKETHYEHHKEYKRHYMQKHYANNKTAYKVKNRQNHLRIQERRKKMMAIIKSVGCALCSEKRFILLDMHHLNKKTKDIEIARLRTVPAVLNEIGKCVVLCCVCHRLLHAGMITLPESLNPIDINKLLVYDLRPNKPLVLSTSS